MKLPDKDLRTRDYGAWIGEISAALNDELRGAKISYLDALHALEFASRLLNEEAMSQGMEALDPRRERHG